ncbi:SusC/RagA family TonB-linked outer membrane protein [Pedobacter sp. MW01-1-1]|uniref:SusC/RagA family TonB-linked outer membrane protein n=1 Tax=Pedobacter sp. MW01-1-1 TaxID=3383027 RepID=UPI003FEE0F25
MKKIIQYIILIATCLTQVVYAQNKTVTGTIGDKAGPIPGVSVYEKGMTANGATTNEDGKFTLKLRGTSNVLIVKMVGYLTKEVNVANGSSFNIKIEDDTKGLEDVIVTGFSEKKNQMTNTSAVSSLSGDVIRQSPTASVQNALAGRLPGFFSQQRSGQPGADGAAFQIRGVSTYQGSNTPLIIIDDIEVTADQINMIDQNEIETLTILKDASTTAVYGVRGANGVVIITTRRGKAGKPQLNFRQETGVTKSAVNFETNDAFTTLSLLKEWTVEQYLDPVSQYPKFFAGNNLEHYRLQDDPYKYPYVNWWDEITKDYSMQNRTNFDISGGSEKAKYFVSLGYLNQGGMYKDFTDGEGYNGNYQYDRYNFRSNVDLTPTPTLKIRFDLSGRFGVTNSPNDAPANNGGRTLQYLWNGQLSAFGYPAYNADGSYGGSTSGSTKINPIANLRWSGYNRDYSNNIGFVSQVDQKLNFITEGLAANVLVSYASDYDFRRSLTRNSNEMPTYYWDDNTQSYLPVVNNLYRLGKLNRAGSYQGSNSLLNIQARLNYTRSFGNHNVSAFALLNQTTTATQTATVANDPYNVRGIVGSLSYNYKQRYVIDFKGSYNGSDKFQSSKKYQLFPAVSVAYNISEEPFFKNNLPFISNLKFRGSYGQVGNDGIGSSVYSYEKTYVPGSGKGYVFGETGNTAQAGIIEPTLSNTEVTWETQEDANIGMDLRMFKGKLSFTMDFYKKRRKDILTQRASVASAFGASLPFVNLGIVDNKGYELELNYRDNALKNQISYFVNAQISHSENKVVFRDEGAVRFPWLGNTGKPVGALFAYQDAGLYQSLADVYNSPRLTNANPLSNLNIGGVKLVDLNGDGVVDQYDMGYIGTNQPEYIAGLSFGFSYKGFDISTLFQGSFKYFISINRGIISYSRPENQSIPYNLGRWTPITSTDATFPVLSGSGSQNGAFSTYWLKKGDYVRWKNVEIGYRFPSSFSKKLHLNNLRVYANAYNLGLVYNALPVSIDPESATGTASTTNIGDVNEYPQQAIFNFGLTFGL